MKYSNFCGMWFRYDGYVIYTQRTFNIVVSKYVFAPIQYDDSAINIYRMDTLLNIAMSGILYARILRDYNDTIDMSKLSYYWDRILYVSNTQFDVKYKYELD